MKTLRPVLLPVVALVVVCAIAGGIFAGGDGVLGALLGGAVVVLFLGATPLVLTPMVKAGPMLSLPIALGFLATKSLAVLIVLVLLFDVGNAAEHVDSLWFGIAAVATSFAWTVLQVRGFRSQRVPTYDLDNEG
ncbi:hypothetical protein [Aeromicrobium sp.]|uniref:hypothetical protein n=1 Tax=Aeromicrobium sp. TaxID=1871063 RepID=UPI003C43ECBA